MTAEKVLLCRDQCCHRQADGALWNTDWSVDLLVTRAIMLSNKQRKMFQVFSSSNQSLCERKKKMIDDEKAFLSELLCLFVRHRFVAFLAKTLHRRVTLLFVYH